MPIYSHECRECKLEWMEEYSLKTFDHMKKHNIAFTCPECESEDTFRQINHIAVIFKPGGVGWADAGYYAYGAYDQLQAEGKKVELYERKEDMERVMRGERREAMKRRLKHVDELAKKTLGHEEAFTEADAEKRIKKFEDGVVNHLPPEKKG